jgi:hypothetical protein
MVDAILTSAGRRTPSHWYSPRRGAGVAEQGCLLSSYPDKIGIGGSNPPLSANINGGLFRIYLPRIPCGGCRPVRLHGRHFDGFGGSSDMRNRSCAARALTGQRQPVRFDNISGCQNRINKVSERMCVHCGPALKAGSLGIPQNASETQTYCRADALVSSLFHETCESVGCAHWHTDWSCGDAVARIATRIRSSYGRRTRLTGGARCLVS